MIIHIVQPGDTVASIAEEYGIPAERFVQDNGLNITRVLVEGEALVVAYPAQTYIVQEGDTLLQIAEKNGITLQQLLRNNPYLSDRNYIYPGEELIISYGNKNGKITADGYANYFIDTATLRRTLPFLTYLSVFGNRTTYGGEILPVNDTKIITAAREFRVVPIMMLSTMTEQGRGDSDISYQVVNDENVTDNYINNMLRLLRRKGYYGVNITFQFINTSNSQAYEKFIRKIYERLKQEGYLVFITISENFLIEEDQITFEKVDFTNIITMVDGVILLNYNWGYSFGPPGPVVSLNRLRQFLKYIITMIPPEKIEIGIPIIGYDWELPYIIGETKANSLTLDSAITLAGEVGAVIQFDEVAQNPYFRYVDYRSGIPVQHMVWFIDARTIDAIMGLIMENGFRGVGIWNIMNYYPQLWVIVNSQYEIETLLN